MQTNKDSAGKPRKVGHQRMSLDEEVYVGQPTRIQTFFGSRIALDDSQIITTWVMFLFLQ